MTATMIDGKALAAKLREQVAEEVARLERDGHHAGAGRGAGGRGPGQPGLRPLQGARCAEAGMASFEHRLSEDGRGGSCSTSSTG